MAHVRWRFAVHGMWFNRRSGGLAIANGHLAGHLWRMWRKREFNVADLNVATRSSLILLMRFVCTTSREILFDRDMVVLMSETIRFKVVSVREAARHMIAM